MDKNAIARRFMARIPVMYEQLMRMHPDGLPSLGLVARWDRVGGFSGNISSTTENVAMKSLTLNEMQKEMMAWLDAVYAVFFRLIDATGKNGPKAAHDKLLANVLKGRVFDSMTSEQIKMMHFRKHVSSQYVSKLYSDCVELVAKEAEKRGLFKYSA